VNGYKKRYPSMKNEDAEYFREVLSRWQNDLLNQADVTVRDLLESTVKAIDPVDQASLETNRNFTLRIRDRESRLIGKIKQSLARIEEDTFGICDVCGKEITLPRLRARPVTTFCIVCKNKMETREKAIRM